MAAAGARDRDPAELELVLDRPHVGEAAVAQDALVGRLADQRHVLGQQVDGGLVEVVGVQVGHEHRVEPAHEHLGGLGELAQRVAAVVGRVGHGGPRAGRVEHGIDQHAAAADLDEQRRVSDQPQPHP